MKLILKWFTQSARHYGSPHFGKINTFSFYFLGDCISFTKKRRLLGSEELVEERIQSP